MQTAEVDHEEGQRRQRQANIGRLSISAAERQAYRTAISMPGIIRPMATNANSFSPIVIWGTAAAGTSTAKISAVSRG